MKLATYQDGSRDGQLVVVSQNLSQAHYASNIATRMQQLLDDWNFIAPQLEQLYQQLNHGKAPHAFDFDPARCMAPLPRPTDYLFGNLYARVLDEQTCPQIIAASSNSFVAQNAIIPDHVLQRDVDFSAGLACITDDIAYDTHTEAATESIRLLMLATHIVTNSASASLQLAENAGFQNQPMTVFSPVVITPDELQDNWHQGKTHLRLDIFFNNQVIARCPTDDALAFSFGELLSCASQAHRIAAGTILCTGPVLHSDKTKGYTSIALKRHWEQLDHQQASTPYLQPGDTLRVEIKGKDGLPLFGTISLKAEQQQAAISGDLPPPTDTTDHKNIPL